MLNIRLDTETARELEALANETGVSEADHIQTAVAAYLQDRADYRAALAVLERDEPRTSLADVRRELGLER